MQSNPNSCTRLSIAIIQDPLVDMFDVLHLILVERVPVKMPTTTTITTTTTTTNINNNKTRFVRLLCC